MYILRMGTYLLINNSAVEDVFTLTTAVDK